MENTPKQVVHTVSSGTVIRIILIVLGFGVLFLIRNILLVLLTAIVIASAMEPAIRWFTRRKLPRLFAVILVYLIILLLIVTISYLILPSLLADLAGFLNKLPKYITALNVKTSAVGSDFSSWRSAILGLSKSESLGDAAKNISNTLSTASGSIIATISSIFGGLTSFVLIFVISIYLTVQERGIEEFLRIVIPIHHEEYVVGLWKRTQYKIGRWMQGQLLLALIIGILVFVALSILRVENAFFFAIISMFFEIIPVFGPIIGAIPGILAAVLQNGFTFGVIVALMYIIVQQIESHIIYPIIAKKILDIQPLIVILALIIGAELGGFLGILLSVPVAVAITEYMHDVNKTRVVAREKINTEHS
jgi:predicted PurR-regulated permease PerM